VIRGRTQWSATARPRSPLLLRVPLCLALPRPISQRVAHAARTQQGADPGLLTWPQSEVQPGTLDARTLRISDGGHTFVETGNGWLCVQGWEGVKSLVPDWHPAASVNPEPELQEGGHAPGETLSSTLSLELAEGTDESGSAAAASSAGASPAGSGGTPGKMQKARRLQAGGNTPGRRTSLTSRLSGKTATRSMGGGGDGGGGGVGAADLNRGRSKTGKVINEPASQPPACSPRARLLISWHAEQRSAPPSAPGVHACTVSQRRLPVLTSLCRV
jgi:hypothetical protein